MAYLEDCFDHKKLNSIIRRISNRLLEDYKKGVFEILAVSGNSGIIIGSIISYKTKIPLLVIRKPGENSHGELVEMSYKFRSTKKMFSKYAILDDFISSGATIKRMIGTLESKYKVELSVIYCWNVFAGESFFDVPNRLNIIEYNYTKYVGVETNKKFVPQSSGKRICVYNI